MYRLADYLEQHGREERRPECPPESFWDAAQNLTDTDALFSVADAAKARHRLRWAHDLYWAANLHRRRLNDGTRSSEYLLAAFVYLRESVEGALKDDLGSRLRRAADTGDPHALGLLADWHADRGNDALAERLALDSAMAGDGRALVRCARRHERAGDQERAESLLRQGSESGTMEAKVELTVLMQRISDRENEFRCLQETAEAGNNWAMVRLASLLDAVGKSEEAEAWLRQAADNGSEGAASLLAARLGEPETPSFFLGSLAPEVEPQDDELSAAALVRRTSIRRWDPQQDARIVDLPHSLRQCIAQGDALGAEKYARRAADAGMLELPHSTDALLTRLVAAQWPYGLDADGSPTLPW